jgi:hypothetical protein
LGVGIALLLAVLSLAGCSKSLADLFGLTEEPPPAETDEDPVETGAFTVTFNKGNGGGTDFTKSTDGMITLPEPGSLTAPATYPDMAFAGWHDGTFTYAAGHEYTVTGNVPLEARWGFTTLEDVTRYLGDPGQCFTDMDGNIPLVVCDGTDTTLTLAALASSITSIPNVELDLSASTLLGMSVETFALAQAKTKAVVLILPRTAKATTGQYNSVSGEDMPLVEVSGLNVTTIGDNAFKDYTKNLKTANFPWVEKIGGYAFSKCSALETADFPRLTTIEGQYAFQNCTSLKMADFRSVTTIGEYAFKGCSSLATANFPLATEIKQYAFQSCKLDTMDFSEATTIRQYAFQSCKLKTANFPKATTIEQYAFYNCSDLEEITVGVNSSTATSIGANAFNYCNKLATITISQGCNINNTNSIPKSFKTVYDTDNQKAAGTYTLTDSTWSKTAD